MSPKAFEASVQSWRNQQDNTNGEITIPKGLLEMAVAANIQEQGACLSLSPLSHLIIAAAHNDQQVILEAAQTCQDKTEAAIAAAYLKIVDFETACARIRLHYTMDVPCVDSKAVGKYRDRITEYLKQTVRGNSRITPAGRKNICASGSRVTCDLDPVEATWLLEYLICEDPNVDFWWPVVIPATLNTLDSADFAMKAKGCKLVLRLCQGHAAKLEHTGVRGVLWETIIPFLHYLPPSVEPEVAEKIVSSAIHASLALACGDTNKLNYAIRQGPLRAIQHSSDNVNFMVTMLNLLNETILQLKSLSIMHLRAIVQSFVQIMSDPFVDASPQLINSATDMMSTAIRYCWPRIDIYKYEIMYGLIKARAVDSQCGKLLAEAADIDLQRIRKLERLEAYKYSRY